MAEIGVIVPVYKSEKFLSRCIDSILSQTFTDYYLVLVDDGSPDNSGAICDSYAARDKRIHVIHLPHVGVSAVRNEGIRYVMEDTPCQWIVFIDSDDWVHPELLERLMKAAQRFGTDVNVAGYADTVDETSPWEAEIPEPELWTPDKFYLEHFINATIPVAKLYRRNCFVGKKYPEGQIHEDEFITYQIMFEQRQVAVILSPMYAYFYNPDSITKKPWTPERLDTWGAFERQIQFFEARGSQELVKFRLRGYLENALVQLEQAENTPNVEKTIRFIKKRIRNIIRRCWHAGCIHFQYDYTMLERFYPLTTKAYRFYLEKIKK